MKQLGLVSTELAALAAFFPGGWRAPAQEVTRVAQGFLLNAAGFNLRALGRLKEAQIPFEREIAHWIGPDEHENAARNSENLSELLHLLGELEAALERSNDAVEISDKTEGNFGQSAYLAHQAHVLANQGKARKAQALFEKARQRQIQAEPESTYLYSIRGFLETSFLLRTAPTSALPDLAERVQATLKIAVRNDWLIDIALDKLNLARIAALTGDESAAAQFDAAIAALRKAAFREYIPLGYLARAGFRRAQDDLSGAWEDLARVRHIAEPSGMQLFLCDALIEEAWLHHLAGKAEKARATFDEAETEVNDMGYHSQDPELDKFRQVLD